jgi:hypothetical protein
MRILLRWEIWLGAGLQLVAVLSFVMGLLAADEWRRTFLIELALGLELSALGWSLAFVRTLGTQRLKAGTIHRRGGKAVPAIYLPWRRDRALGLALLAAGCAGVCFVLAADGSAGAWIGWFGFVFGGAAAVLGVVDATRPQDASLALTSAGLLCGGPRETLIPYDAIRSIRRYSVRGNEMLGLDVDPGICLPDSVIARALAKVSGALPVSPAGIALGRFGAAADLFEPLLRHFLAHPEDRETIGTTPLVG